MIKAKKNSVTKNYIFNLSYQIFLLIVPILVTPYIARIIGGEGVGRYSFTTSLITYFILFASLGFNIYGQRLIAKNQGNTELQSKNFWEIIIARTIPITIAILTLLTLLIFNVFKEYTLLMVIQGISVIAVAFDVTFLFQGNEQFGKLVFRNTVIKILSIISIFIFIKESSDLYIYVLIQVCTTLVSNISLWLYLPKVLTKIKINELHIFQHFKPTLILFLPTIAVSIYTVLDKTLIGVITGSDLENGNYEYAERLVKLSMTIFTSLGAVMIPKNAKMFADGNIEGVKENIYNTSRFVLMIATPIFLGMFCIADNVIPWYLGTEYDKAANIMKILCPIVLIIGMSNVIGLQFLIPSGEDKKFTIAIIIGSISNLILNLILISIIGSYGAAIATVIAEIIVTIVMILFTKDKINYKIIITTGWKYVFAGILMTIPCLVLNNNLNPSIFNSIFIVCVGALAYFLTLFILKDKLIFTILNYKKN